MNIKKNYIYSVIYQIFLLIVPFIVTPYISRVLLPTGVGQYSFSLSNITYFTTFAALGFSVYSQREIARNRENKIEVSKIFWETIICRSLPVLVSILVFVIMYFTNCFGEYSFLMLLLSLQIIATFFDITFLFQGYENFKTIVIRNFIVKVLNVILIFVLVKDANDVWIYTLINAAMLLFSNLSLWLGTRRIIAKVELREIHPLRHLKPTIFLFIPVMASTIYVLINKTLIGVLIPGTYEVIENGEVVIKNISDLENGFYDSADKMIKMALTLITALGSVMVSRNSYEISQGNMEKAKHYFYMSTKFVWFLSLPMMFGIISVAKNFVPRFYGSGYDKVILLLCIESPVFIFIGFSNIYNNLLYIPLKKDKLSGGIAFSVLIINTTLCLCLIPFLNSTGAMIATLLSEFITTAFAVFFFRKIVSLKTILRLSWKYLLAGCLMFAVTFTMGYLLESSVWYTLLIIVCGSLIYSSCLLLLKEELIRKGVYIVKDYFGNLIRKIKNKNNK